jgi:hypothetical protein
MPENSSVDLSVLKGRLRGRYKNWREKQAKERYYRGEIKRVMQEAREAALLDLRSSAKSRALFI